MLKASSHFTIIFFFFVIVGFFVCFLSYSLCYIVQTDLEFTILLLLSLAEISGMCHHAWAMLTVLL
jgi:hypothetical protein